MKLQKGQTKKEYAMEHCLSMDQFCTPEKSFYHINNDNIGINDKIKINSTEYDIILASLYNPNNKYTPTTVYLIEKINNLDYLFWKADKLNRLYPKFKQITVYNEEKGRSLTQNILYFSSNDEINQIITDYTKNTYDISLFCLALIIMDNGTFEHGNLLLTLPKNKIKYFSNYIYEKYSLSNMIVSGDNIISFNNIQLANLKTAISKYMFDDMLYKLGDEYYKLPMCTVSKTVVFDSAHFLDEYDGKCCNLHGGRYSLTVYIKDSINPDTGMVVDFTYLKKILKEEIVSKFDHHCLNYVDKQLAWRSTTELICVYIWDRLVKYFPCLYKIELTETPDSKCEYMGQTLGAKHLAWGYGQSPRNQVS